MIQLHNKKRQICLILQMNILIILILFGSSVNTETENHNNLTKLEPIEYFYWHGDGDRCLLTDWQIILNNYYGTVQCPTIIHATMNGLSIGTNMYARAIFRLTDTLNKWVILTHINSYFTMVLLTFRTTNLSWEVKVTAARYLRQPLDDYDLNDIDVLNALWFRAYNNDHPIATSTGSRGYGINEMTITTPAGGCPIVTESPIITETPIINYHWYGVGELCLPNTDWQLIVSDFNKPVQCVIITDTTMTANGLIGLHSTHSHTTISQHRRTGTLNQWILIIREICRCRNTNHCCHNECTNFGCVEITIILKWYS